MMSIESTKMQQNIIKPRAAYSRSIVLVLLFALLSGCANFPTGIETPSVKLVSLSPLPANGLEQRFVLGLRVTNPNAKALNLVGLSYAVELEGFEIISGAMNDIPSIAAYGDSVVNLEASVSLLEGVRLLSSFLSKPKGEMNYRISAKLDTGLPILGKIPVTDSGIIDFSK